jgi:hypothetical protein
MENLKDVLDQVVGRTLQGLVVLVLAGTVVYLMYASEIWLLPLIGAFSGFVYGSIQPPLHAHYSKLDTALVYALRGAGIGAILGFLLHHGVPVWYQDYHRG